MTIYYQFLSSRDAITDLERKMIKVSRIKNLNDLFELQPYLRIDKGKRRRLEKVRTKIADTHGMVCLSGDWQESLLWGHYADRNRGIALGFEFVSRSLRIFPVTYPSKREMDPFGNREDITPCDYIKELGYKKYANWSYEKEYRFFVKLDDCLDIEGNFFLKFDNTLVLRKVIVGPEHPYKNRRSYANTARYFAELVKSFGAEVMVTRPERGGYRIVRCGLWTPRFEQLMTKHIENE